MKSSIAAIIAFVAFTGLCPAAPAVPYTEASIETRLRQIDLDVAIRHYEKLQTMLREARLEHDLEGETRQESHPAVQQLDRKMKVLENLLERTRAEIRDLGKALEAAGATEDPTRDSRLSR